MKFYFEFFLIFLIIILLSFSVSAKVFQEDGKYYIEQELNKGWNLISGISFSDIHKDSQLKKEHIWKSYYHNAKINQDIELRPTYKAKNVEPLILYSNAFWVYSIKSGKVIYKASPSFINKSRVGNSYQFYPGWNAIGINNEIYGKSLEEIKGNCTLLDARIWDAKKQEWKSVSLNEKLNFESEDELVGKGISVKVESECGFFSGEGDIQEFCGDSVCGEAESCSICKEDCGACNYCGDGICDANEGVFTCKEDCNFSVSNKKRTNLYSDKEAFLVSDSDWKEVLPLVPVATWTQYEGDNSLCQRGYLTPKNVCTYPALIYHKEINQRNYNLDLIEEIEKLPNSEDYDVYGDSIYYIDSHNSSYWIKSYNFSNNLSDVLFKSKSISKLAVNNNYIVGIEGSYDYVKRSWSSNLLVLDKVTHQNKSYNLGQYTPYTPLLGGKGDYSVLFSDYGTGKINVTLFNFSDSSFKFLFAFEGFPRGKVGISESGYIFYPILENGESYLGKYDYLNRKATKIKIPYDISRLYKILNTKGDNFVISSYSQDESTYQVFLFNALDGTSEFITNEGYVLDANDRGVLVQNDNDRYIYYYDFLTKNPVGVSDVTGNYLRANFYDSYKIFVLMAQKESNDFRVYNILDENYSTELSLDRESIFDFIKQYDTKNLTLVGEVEDSFKEVLVSSGEIGSGLNSDKIKNIKSENYLSYWEEFNDVVHVEDNYSQALIASVYASLINAPLIIEGTEQDKDEYFTNRNIVCVGDVKRVCDEQYNSDSLMQRYSELTKTDKIILINSQDWNLSERGALDTKPNLASSLYSKTSLASPFLASAKHEIIIDSKGNSSLGFADNLIEEKSNRIFNNFESIQGIKVNRSIDYYSVSTFFKNDQKIRDYWGDIGSTVLKDNRLLYSEGNKFFSYNFETGEIETYGGFASDFGGQRSWKISGNNVLYKYSSDFSTCSLGKFDLLTHENKFLLNVDSSCWGIDFVEKNNEIYLSKSSEKKCGYSRKLCTGDSDCTSKFCSNNRSACNSDLDCGSNNWCAKDYCSVSNYGIYKIINNSQELILGNFSNSASIDFYGDLLIISNKANSAIFFYNITNNKYESLLELENLRSGEIHGADYTSGYLLLLYFNASWGGNLHIGVYDLNTKTLRELKETPYGDIFNDFYFFKIKTYDNKVYWSPKPRNKNGRCSEDLKKACSDNSDCDRFSVCYPTTLKSYDLKSGESEEFVFSTVKFNPIVYNKDIFSFGYSGFGEDVIKGYLTVIGAENSVEAKKEMGLTSPYDNRRSLDVTEYADLDDDYYPDMAVGRIQGITLSDVSSNIARSLFYDKLGYENSNAFLVGNGKNDDHNGAFEFLGKIVHNWSETFEDAGYNVDCLVGEGTGKICHVYHDKQEEWIKTMPNKSFVYMGHHGSSSYVGIYSSQIPSLKSGMLFTDACSACATYTDDSFCNNALKKGSVSVYGALGISWSGNRIYEKTLEGVYKDNLTIGQSFAKSFERDTSRYMTIPLGDPTFRPVVKYKIPEDLAWQ